MISQDLAQDLKVFLVKILETSCEELIKNLVRFSHDLVDFKLSYLHSY